MDKQRIPPILFGIAIGVAGNVADRFISKMGEPTAAFVYGFGAAWVIIGILNLWKTHPAWLSWIVPMPSLPEWGTHIAKHRIRLADLVNEHGWIDSKVIEDCTIVGPGVLMSHVGDGSRIENDCIWETPGPKEWTVALANTDPAGSFRLRNTIFRRCRFVQVGMNTGPLTTTVAASSEVTHLVQNRWALHFNPKREQHKPIGFAANGQITTGRNDNESTWKFERGALVIYRKDGTVHNRFRFNPSTNQYQSTNETDTWAIKVHRIENQYIELV